MAEEMFSFAELREAVAPAKPPGKRDSSLPDFEH
jgi:hypothetical protein